MKILSPIKLPVEVFELLHNNRVLLSYYGSLDLELVNQLLEKIKGNSLLSANQGLKSKLYACLAELIENAYKHQSSVNDERQNCIVIINLHKGVFQVSVGNVISSKNRKVLINEFERINQLELSEISAEVLTRLKDADYQTSKSAKLGLLKTALKAENRMYYSLQELDEGSEFVLIRVLID